MTASILVATPHVAFGELLKSSLEDSGQYKVTVVHTGKETRGASSRGNYQLAIVDSAIRDQMFVPLCMDLLAQQANMRLMVIPPENNPNHPSLGGLMPHGYLTRPFYLPDLIDSVARLIKQRAEEDQPHAAPAVAPPEPLLPTWLQEPMTLSRYLDQELPITQALAGIVAVDGPELGMGSVRASAGRLNQDAASELSAIVFRYWPRGDKADLVRFVRLSSEKQDYLVYATQMINNLLLILVYETSAPISMIRPQTKTLAHMLATMPPMSITADVRPVKPSPEMRASPPAQEQAASGTNQAAETSSQQQAEIPTAPSGPDDQPTNPISQPPGSQPVKPQSEDQKPERKSALNEPETEPLDDYLLRSRTRSGFPLVPPDDSGLEENEDSGEESSAAIFDLTALLGSIPSPDPSIESRTNRIPTPGRSSSGMNGWERSNGYGEESAAETLPAAESLPTAENLPEQQNLPTIENVQPAEGPSEIENPPVSEQPAIRDISAGPDLVGPPAAGTEQAAPAEENEAQHDSEEVRRTQEWLASLNRPINTTSVPKQEAVEQEAEPAEFPDWLLQIGPPPPEVAKKAPEPVQRVEQTKPAKPFVEDSKPPVSSSRSGAPSEPPSQPTPKVQPVPPLPETKQPLPEFSLPFQAADEEEPESIGSQLVLEPERAIDPLEDTRPHVLSAITNLSQLEPISPALSLLNYTCVLVPRLPQHYLTGELADRLSQWVHQLCLAFGWRLEGISVRPEYLQWTIQVAPSVSPGNLVRIIRQRTSLNIFNQFSHLAEQNPSGDFWAIGYLIVSGAQPPSAQLLREYISQTRKRQGVNR